ncbi:MAG TPA: class II fumarate hydratase [Mycobacteriales bacterium]|nr:class II fumarate hydratase [Mycobacteriales bacterium]
MGDVRVPAAARWGAQTQRAVENFPISGRRVDADVIAALAAIKGCSAAERAHRGLIEPALGAALAAVSEEIAAGQWADQFPVDVFQTGSGTSTNMNVNEVMASLASERLDGQEVHPNDGVNDPLSSNDQFPSALHIAAAHVVTAELRPALEHLAVALEVKRDAWRDVVKAGRTHLMDAVPVTLGQEFGGYAAAMRLGIDRLDTSLPRVCALPLGGTAVGTGLNAPAGFGAAVIARLADVTGLPLTPASDAFEAQSSRDALAELSGMTRVVALSVYKLANDLRLMGSGPRAGFAELHLPDLQPGSSIMPGKVNPVIPEAACQVVAQVIGNDATVAFGCAAGTFELNVMMPVIGRGLLESLHLLAAVSRLLADRCIDGLTADEARLRRLAESSPAIVTALNHALGYDEAASIAKQALAEGKTIREVVIERGHVTSGRISEADLDAALDVLAMAWPHRSA